VIYNRVTLEVAQVRATAIHTLARFAALVPSLKKSVLVILQRSLQDEDDEVRDRSVFYLNILKSSNENIEKYILSNEIQLKSDDFEKLSICVDNYLLNGDFSNKFELNEIKKIKLTKNVTAVVETEVKKVKEEKKEKIIIDENPLANIEEFKELGKPFKISKKALLTELDSDYVIYSIKYVFDKHIVLQFDCTNKVEDQLLTDVLIKLNTNYVEGVREKFNLNSSKIYYEETDSVYTYCMRNPKTFPIGSAQCTMKFNVKEVDPESKEVSEESEEEDFPLNYKLNFNISDYMKPIVNVDFKTEWANINEQNEKVSKNMISNSSIQETINSIISFLDINSLNPSEVPLGKNTYNLFFAAEFTDKSIAYFIIKLAYEGKTQYNITVRSLNSELRESIIKSFQNK
jgi:coatomer subunit gamma